MQLLIENVSKTYSNDVKALRNVSLEIGNGMFGLLGPNGAGKTTCFYMIAGIVKADQGKIQGYSRIESGGRGRTERSRL